jgi:hypothetical protein
MLKQRLSEIGQKRARREQEVRLLQGLEEFSGSVRHSLEDPSFETRQQVLQLVVDRIAVEDTKVVIHHVVPAGPVRLQTEQLPLHRIKQSVSAAATDHAPLFGSGEQTIRSLA